MTHYQWHCMRCFRDILGAVPYAEWLKSYAPLHEADIRKVCDVMDERSAGRRTGLGVIRKLCGLSQRELSERSGMSINTLRAYEQKVKNINRAQADHLRRMAGAMHCLVRDLVD